MKCPVCNEEMRRVGFQKVAGSSVIEEWECPSCHYRIQGPATKMPKRRLV